MGAAEKVVEEKKKRILLPEGEYIYSFDNYLEQENSKKTGRRGTLIFSILARGQEYHAQEMFVDLNVENPSEKAVEISTKLLNQFLIATGECPNGLADIGYDRTKLIDFKGYKVVADVRQKMGNDYVNRNGVKVAGTMKNEVRAFKAA
jgi:hypothetical protein